MSNLEEQNQEQLNSDTQTLDNAPIEKEVSKKKGKIKYILSAVFMITLIIITIVILANKFNFSQIWNLLTNVNILWVLLGVFMIIIYVFFEGYAMKIIFRSMGQKVGFLPNFVYSAIDYYFCAITPSATGGQPMVAYYMSKDKISIPHVSITLLINTALFKIVLVTLACVGLIMYPALVFGGDNPGLMIGLFIFGASFNVFLIIMCFLATFKKNWIEKGSKKFLGWLSRRKIVKRKEYWDEVLDKKMKEYGEAGKLIGSNKRHFAYALFINYIQRIALFSVTYFVFMAFYTAEGSYGLQYHSFFELFAVQVIIALCVDSLPLPGGVGISEVLNLLLLGTVFTSSIIAIDEMVASAMLLTRAVSFYIPVIITGIISLIKHFSVMRGEQK